MNGKVMREAMLCETQRQADLVVSMLVAELMNESPEMSLESADYTARQRIGYSAGRCTHATRDRVERLFKTAHPIFGSIQYNGAPSIEQVAVLGMEYGKATRENPMFSRTKYDPLQRIAEIPRVDPSRVKREATGIYTHALAADGKYDDCDISHLTCDSLIRFVRARGGRNVFAEGLVLQILGHEIPEHMRAPVRPK